MTEPHSKMAKPRSKSVVSPQKKSSNPAACNHYARGKRLLTCGLVLCLFYEVLSILNKKVLYLFADLWKMPTFASANAKTAEIAQLVEHNLAPRNGKGDNLGKDGFEN